MATTTTAALLDDFRDSLALYRRYVTISFRSQLQYRTSFLLLCAGNLLTTGTEFIGVWALFDRFGNLRGWKLPEIALFYGVINIAFALTESIARGFDTFPSLIKNGDFDRLLLRPRSTALQVLGGEFQLMRLGRFTQGIVILMWAMHALRIAWTPARIALLFATILGGAGVFGGLFILQAALSFWTIESLEIMNTVTYGGTETAQYPLTIYRPWFRRFFTFVVPLACANYLPLAPLLHHTGSGMLSGVGYAAPLIGLLFLSISMLSWRAGVRHYHSTGS